VKRASTEREVHMFGLSMEELAILVLVGVLLVGGVVYLFRAGILGPPKISRDEEKK
jgi:hypothetical protein